MHIQFDGGSKGTGEANPGECGAGFVITDVKGAEILHHGIYIWGMVLLIMSAKQRGLDKHLKQYMF